MWSRDKLMKQRRNWLRSQMDCGEEGCGECRVCRRLDFLEWARMVAPRDIPSTVQHSDVDDYIRRCNIAARRAAAGL